MPYGSLFAQGVWCAASAAFVDAHSCVVASFQPPLFAVAVQALLTCGVLPFLPFLPHSQTNRHQNSYLRNEHFLTFRPAAPSVAVRSPESQSASAEHSRPVLAVASPLQVALASSTFPPPTGRAWAEKETAWVKAASAKRRPNLLCSSAQQGHLASK